ncbi:hypothetical protein KA005_38190 [bacterium]|nr:hypothetical protein [bacterium]
MKLVYFFVYGQWWSAESKYKYMATDRNGEIYIYVDRPILYPDEKVWGTHPFDTDELPHMHIIPHQEHVFREPCPGWAQSLVRLK